MVNQRQIRNSLNQIAMAALATGVALFILCVFVSGVALAEDVKPVELAAPPAGPLTEVKVPSRANPAQPQQDQCFAQIRSGATFSGTDATALRSAVSAATSGDWVKIAGTCAGSQVLTSGTDVYTQVLYIDKNLTFEGGYSPDDWAVSDPGLHPTTLDAQTIGRGIYIHMGYNITVTKLTIANGLAPYGAADCGNPCYGGGILVDGGNLHLIDSHLTNNTAQIGGGIYNLGHTTIETTTFTNNNASEGGGAVYNTGLMSITQSVILSNTAGAGGAGLANQGTLTVVNTLIAYNVSDNHVDKGSGGGFQNGQGDIGVSIASFINSTIANNSANGANDEGGGGLMIFKGTVNLLNTTVAFNTSLVTHSLNARDAGGITSLSVATTTLQNSLVAANVSSRGRPDLGGTMKSGGGNLVGISSGNGIVNNQRGDRTGNSASPLNPLLAPLNLDPNIPATLHTVAVLPGSPAIYLLTGTGCNGAPAHDPRRVIRPGDHCDTGAYQHEWAAYYFDLAQGGGQHTTVNSYFEVPISVTVLNDAGEPVTGGRISFISPSSGAGTAPTTTIGIIDENGIASVLLRANNLAGSNYVVTATANGIDDPDFLVTFIMTNDPLPIDLRLTLDVTPADVIAGEALTYTLTYSNAGDGVASTVFITDLLSGWLTNVAYTNTGTVFVNQGGAPFQWSIPSLPGHSGGIVTITGILTPDVAGVATIPSTAIIEASDGSSSSSNSVSTNFNVWYRLHAAKDGNGTGSYVIYQPGGEPYPGNADISAPYGTDFVLEPAAGIGSDMTWSSNCLRDGYLCNLTLTSTMNVTATFFLNQFSIITSYEGSGQGTVQFDPAPDGGSNLFNYGRLVTLTAVADSGSVFTGWTGAISSTQTSFTVVMTGDVEITATFVAQYSPIDLRLALSVTPTKATPSQFVTYTLVYSNAGLGTAYDTMITDSMPVALTSVSFTNTGAITMNQIASGYLWNVGNLSSGMGGIVTITGMIKTDLGGVSTISNTALTTAIGVVTPTSSSAFVAMWYLMRTATSGNGAGSVVLSPTGTSFPYGTSITATVAPATGSHLGGWSANCTVQVNLCRVTLTSTSTVTATFVLDTHALTVTTAGKGRGSVVISPTLALYNYGTQVTLRAVISPASFFTGWSGGILSTTSPITLTITSETTVIANFDTRRTFVPMLLRR